MTAKRFSSKRSTAPAVDTGPIAQRIKIMIIDDHPLMRCGIVARLEQERDMQVCAEADSVASALAAVAKTAPDVAIVDLALKDSHGLDLIKELRKRRPAVKVLVLSAYSEALYGERVLRLGALGFINKQQAQTSLVNAVRCVAAGKRYVSDQLAQRLVERALGGRGSASLDVEALSDRELQVFELIGDGVGTRAIAERLDLSVHTIETYRENIRAKLDLRNGSELVQHAVRWVMEHG
jgi:DNA-binding NarL/FixJ family response regulator